MVFVFVLLSSFSWVSTERTEKKTHTKNGAPMTTCTWSELYGYHHPGSP